ncbi:hypothetical protein [Burkholderia ubonensis]|nr:hypothetical protein [Burkholderia ubonensis]
MSSSAPPTGSVDPQQYKEVMHSAARDASQVALRFDLARFFAKTAAAAGEELHVLGYIVGPDRAAGLSPFGNGSDETVAVSILLQVAAQLVSASADLFDDGRLYAAAALLRQLVEVEYLAWAFETKNGEAERWLRSDRQERESFFTPAKLRKAAAGKFRSKDYGYHCELGGHPVPGSRLLLGRSPETSQLLLSDLLGHAGRIWEHFVGWARDNPNGTPILNRTTQLRERFVAWKVEDRLVDLPPPP